MFCNVKEIHHSGTECCTSLLGTVVYESSDLRPEAWSVCKRSEELWFVEYNAWSSGEFVSRLGRDELARISYEYD